MRATSKLPRKLAAQSLVSNTSYSPSLVRWSMLGWATILRRGQYLIEGPKFAQDPYLLGDEVGVSSAEGIDAIDTSEARVNAIQIRSKPR